MWYLCLLFLGHSIVNLLLFVWVLIGKRKAILSLVRIITTLVLLRMANVNITLMLLNLLGLNAADFAVMRNRLADFD